MSGLKEGMGKMGQIWLLLWRKVNTEREGGGLNNASMSEKSQGIFFYLFT